LPHFHRFVLPWSLGNAQAFTALAIKSGSMCGGFTHSQKYFLSLSIAPSVIKYGLICLWFTLDILRDMKLHDISSKLF
jgi:hypothetical protein